MALEVSFWKNNFKALVLAGAAALLTGCSTPTELKPPAPLDPLSSPYALEKQWQLQLSAFIPAQAEGLYFESSEQAVYIGVPGGYLTKATKQPQGSWSDQVVWQKKLATTLTAGPTRLDRQLFVGTGKGQLISLSEESGQVRWQVALSSEVISRPVLGDSQLFVRTVDGKLYALNPQNGQVNWVIERSLPNLSLRGVAPVTFAEGTLYIGWENGQIEALDARTGQSQWATRFLVPSGRTDLERLVDIQAALLYQDGRLFALGYQGKVAALNPATGNFYWTRDVSGYRDMSVDAQALYLVSDESEVLALDKMNGTVLWQQEALQGRYLIDVLTYDANQLLTADRFGKVHWLDRVDGALTGRVQISNDLGTGNAISRLWLDGNTLYTLDGDGYVKAYRIKPSDWYQFNHPGDPRGLFSTRDDDGAK
ncbi:outer membrane protein assembly factor BamB [Thiomicrospira sp. WB1]|nr:outer membrane protein assembly factor BamB [Thiomicrospira sp. WB1]